MKKPPAQTYLRKGLFRGDICILYECLMKIK